MEGIRGRRDTEGRNSERDGQEKKWKRGRSKSDGKREEEIHQIQEGK